MECCFKTKTIPQDFASTLNQVIARIPERLVLAHVKLIDSYIFQGVIYFP